jgi:hypothetical protein
MNLLSAFRGSDTQRRRAQTIYSGPVYTPPPRLLRYTLERWSWEDEAEERHAGETYAHVDCVVCHTIFGDFRVGEYVIDDSLSIDFYHVGCAPRHVRWLAFFGTLVCLFRAIMGIDTAYKRPVDF